MPQAAVNINDIALVKSVCKLKANGYKLRHAPYSNRLIGNFEKIKFTHSLLFIFQNR